MNMAASSRVAYPLRKGRETIKNRLPRLSLQREEIPMPQVEERPAARHRELITGRSLLVVVLLSSMIFVALVSLVFVKYAVAETQIAINDLNSTIHEVKNEQTRLVQRLDSAKNISEIMSRAAGLGMGQPKESQILYVQLEDGQAGASLPNED